MTKQQSVRYGVVGAGWISQAAFLPAVAQTGNSSVTAIVTGDTKKAEALTRMYGLQRAVDYDQLETLLEDDVVDAIYLATPNDQHVDMALRTLRAGVPLLLEKPMAISEDECRRIADAAAETGTPVMIAYRLHYDPATLAALELVRGGTLGAVRCFSSVFGQPVSPSNHRAQEGYWAGPVPDMGTYPINAARQLFESEPIEVSAVGSITPGLGFDFHDTVAVTLRFADGRLAQFTVSYATAAVGEYRVVGSKGHLEVRRGYSFEEPIEHLLQIGDDVKKRTFDRVDQFSGEIHAFSKHVLDGTPPEPDAYEGWADVRILAAVERALRTGQPVALEPFAQRLRYARPEQVERFPPTKTPELVDAAAPSDG